ncbi:MAG TPA: DUF418 domain-containing protein, partial [Ilumatobacteraceae bacterium]|nr:DUF418 domain-containing protein [Ilumatobacteraceae bacterium]
LLFDTFVNGTHPLLPWLAFLCAGMALGRYLPLRHEWRRILIALGLVMVSFSYLANHAFAETPLRSKLFATDPFSRSLNYTISALGSSIVAFCVIGWIANTTKTNAITRAFAAAGRMTLTLYIAHALVFNLVVRRWGLIRPTGLDVALGFAAGFWLLGIAAAAWWQKYFGIGPAEWVYRRFGGSNMAVVPTTTAPEPATTAPR